LARKVRLVLLKTLSHYSQVVLRHFIAAWVLPEAGPHRIPKPVAEAMDALTLSRARKNTQEISYN
jgi:hypothetical protein